MEIKGYARYTFINNSLNHSTAKENKELIERKRERDVICLPRGRQLGGWEGNWGYGGGKCALLMVGIYGITKTPS